MVSIGEALIAMELLGIGAAALLWKDPAAVQAQVAVQGPKRPPGAPGLPPTFPRPPGGPPLPPRPSEDTGAGTGLNNRGPRPLRAPPLRPPDDAPDDFAFRNPLFSRGPRQPRAPGQPLQPLQPLQPRAPLQPLQPRAPLQPLQPQPPLRPPVDEAARLELERAVKAIHEYVDVSYDAQGNPQVLLGPIGSSKVWKIVKTGNRIQFRNPDTNQLVDRIPPSLAPDDPAEQAAAQAAAAQAAAAQAAAAQAEAERVAAAQAEADRVAAAQAEAERVAAAQAAAAQAAAAQAAAAQAAEQAAAAQAAAQPAPAPAEPALQVVTNPLANLRRPPPPLPGQVDVDSGGEGGDEGSVVVNPLRSARVPAPRSGVPPLPGASVRNPLHNISEYLNGRGNFIARYVTSVETNNEAENPFQEVQADSDEEKQALASAIWGAVQRKSLDIKQRIANDHEKLDPGTYSLYSSSASDSASASDVGNTSSVPSTPFPAGPPPTPAAPAAPADELPVVNEEVEAGEEEEEEEEAAAPRRRPKPLRPRQVPLGFNPNTFTSARSRQSPSSTPTLNVDYRGNFGNTNALAARRGDTAEQILSQTRGAQLQRDIANASPLGFLQRLQRTNANRLTTGRATYGGRRRGKGRKSTFRKKRKGGK